MRIGFLYLVVFCFAFLGCYNPKNNTDDSAKNGLLFWGLNVLKNSSDQIITGTGTGTGVGAGTATGTGTGSTATAVTAPTSIIYAGSPYTYTRNTGITTLIPTLSPAGVSLTGCTASPALPAGLTLDSTTCAISGTPTVSSTAAFYTITASNSAGNVTATINITVEAIWAQEAYLKAPNPDTSDQFGISVSLSSDTIVVGAKLEGSNQTTITNGATASPDNSAIGAGAAYVFKRTGATWAQEAYLKAPNGEASDYLGQAVSVSADTIAVGAFNECSNQTTITNGTTASANNTASGAGAVYVFKRTGTTWAQEAYLKAPNAFASAQFGGNVSISTDTIVVGSIGESSNQTTITNGTSASADHSLTGAGGAYVFKRTGTTWAQEAYLKAPNNASNLQFGVGVSVSSDTIVVGANGEGSNQTTITNGTTAAFNNSTPASGAVYVFKRTGTTWAQEAYIKTPNPDVNDGFGRSVSVSSDTIVVGAIGESSNQATITNGATASADNSASNAGAVYVFKRTGSIWAMEAYLKAPNVELGDNFGQSVSVSSDMIAVGATGEDSNQTTITNGTTASLNNSAANSGSVYVFKRTGTTWGQEAYLKAPNAEANDNFGVSVFVSSDTIVVGASLEDSNQTTITNGTTASSNNSTTNAGAVYVFRKM